MLESKRGECTDQCTVTMVSGHSPEVDEVNIPKMQIVFDIVRTYLIIFSFAVSHSVTGRFRLAGTCLV